MSNTVMRMAILRGITSYVTYAEALKFGILLMVEVFTGSYTSAGEMGMREE